jgi:sodium/bile acid cotransporter 7
MNIFLQFARKFILSIFGVRLNLIWFICLMIFLAYMSSGVGSHFVVGYVTAFGFFVMFFFYGVGMNPTILWNGISSWKLHLITQLTTFLIFPLIVLFVRYFFVTELTKEIWLGIFYVAVLPSTVSSAVVMVSLARGNVTAAIFNASISGVIGVFVTPLWMSIFINDIAGAGNFSVGKVIFDLLMIIVLPLCLGMCFNKTLGNWMTKNRKYLKYFDQSMILLVVYSSFAKSFASNAFSNIRMLQLIFLCLGMLLLFFCVYCVILVCCKIMRFNAADTIMVLFCGSKKSLVHGITMSKIIFAGMASAGILLLPIMIYHVLQLIATGIIAQHFATKQEKNDQLVN